MQERISIERIDSTTDLGLKKFRQLVDSLDDNMENWPSVQEIEDLFDNNPNTVFYLAENSKGNLVGGFMGTVYEEGKVYGWCLLAHPDFKANPIGSLIVLKLQEDFEVITTRINPFGYPHDISATEERRLLSRLSRYYESLGFSSDDPEIPSYIKWQRQQVSS